MLNQKKVEIFLVKFRKPPTKQFLEVAFTNFKKKTAAMVCKNICRYFIFFYTILPCLRYPIVRQTTIGYDDFDDILSFLEQYFCVLSCVCAINYLTLQIEIESKIVKDGFYVLLDVINNFFRIDY